MLRIFAYLDAGTGSLLLQSLVGVVAGIVLFGRRLFYSLSGKIKSLFSKQSSSTPASE